MDSRNIVRTVSLRDFEVKVGDTRELVSLGSGLAETLWKIAFIREKKLSYSDLLASRHIKRWKTSPSIDMRRSITSLLKLPTIWRKHQEELRPLLISSTSCSELHREQQFPPEPMESLVPETAEIQPLRRRRRLYLYLIHQQRIMAKPILPVNCRMCPSKTWYYKL